MSKILKGALIGLCLFMFNISASYSQVPERSGCKSLEEAKTYIQEKHGEQIIFRGISARGHITFIFLIVIHAFMLGYSLHFMQSLTTL